jgi:hypothetical protein
MAAYKIVCADRLYEHRHITHVGTGPGPANEKWTVMQVRTALRDGDRFYTEDPATGRTADVEPYNANVGGKIIYTIRSTPDSIKGNNLDYIRGCSWKS